MLKTDRRQFRRLPVDLWVREERGDFYFLYRCTDLSEGGMFLAGRRVDGFSIWPKPASRFFIPLPGSTEPLVLKGRTVWQRTESNNDHSGGSAIQFDFAPLRYLVQVRRLFRASERTQELVFSTFPTSGK